MVKGGFKSIFLMQSGAMQQPPVFEKRTWGQ